MFAREFIKVLEQYPEETVFVDLFGGSGLLSHIAKCQKPKATVVYNDFDNYRQRLENIPRTNALLADLRKLAEGIDRHKVIKGGARERIFGRLEKELKEYGYIDFITVSSSLMFSMKYKASIEEMRKEALYNNIRKSDYPLATDFLEGITVVSADYKEVFEQYKDTPNVVFLIDPPYLSTEVGTYTMYWKLADYLDVLTILAGHQFVYFTSNKSSIVELCDWLGKNPSVGNPFRNCRKVEFNATVNHSSHYTDMMFYTQQEDHHRIAA